MGTKIKDEAQRTAMHGEIGNSDAIRLLSIPHSSLELQELLRCFGGVMTPSARSKLTVAMHVPLSPGVDNQRFEPLFDRYPVSGNTHTTANGDVVLTNIQYYNGRMLQVYGEGTNRVQIEAALAGTGYRPVTLRYPDGRHVAVLQVWAQHLFDTSIGPYDSMFLVIPVVPASSPVEESTLHAHLNGYGSALTMLGGRYSAQHARRENAARLYFVRLYDSTRVAIDVGRERMGTDKRPGSIEVHVDGDGLRLMLSDGQQRLMATGHLRFAPRPEEVIAQLAEAGRYASIDTSPLPAGTEHVFGALARIDKGPLHSWQWRTDVTPKFHPVPGGAIRLHGESEEGAMLLRWGFTPRVMGYFSRIRGVITGLPGEDTIAALAHSDANVSRLSPARYFRQHS